MEAQKESRRVTIHGTEYVPVPLTKGVVESLQTIGSLGEGNAVQGLYRQLATVLVTADGGQPADATELGENLEIHDAQTLLNRIMNGESLDDPPKPSKLANFLASYAFVDGFRVFAFGLIFGLIVDPMWLGFLIAIGVTIGFGFLDAYRKSRVSMMPFPIRLP